MSVRLIAAVAIVAALAARAHATPSQELDAARDLFRAGQFADAVPKLNYLLYPQARLSQEDDLLEAHVLLAACTFEAGDRVTARREFEEALSLQRDLTLDSLLYSSAAVDFFDDIKADLEERERREAEQRRLAEENERLQARLAAMVVYETRPYYVNFIPFGAGQFQNDDRTKGLFFAATQGVTGGVSAAIWLYLVTEFGLPGEVPPERVNSARLLQQIEIGVGGVCLGLMAWGVIDSLLHYKPSVRVAPDKSMLTPEPAPKPTSSLRLDPEVFAGGAGLSLTWEY